MFWSFALTVLKIFLIAIFDLGFKFQLGFQGEQQFVGHRRIFVGDTGFESCALTIVCCAIQRTPYIFNN